MLEPDLATVISVTASHVPFGSFSTWLGTAFEAAPRPAPPRPLPAALPRPTRSLSPELACCYLWEPPWLPGWGVGGILSGLGLPGPVPTPQPGGEVSVPLDPPSRAPQAGAAPPVCLQLQALVLRKGCAGLRHATIETPFGGGQGQGPSARCGSPDLSASTDGLAAWGSPLPEAARVQPSPRGAWLKVMVLFGGCRKNARHFPHKPLYPPTPPPPGTVLHKGHGDPGS